MAAVLLATTVEIVALRTQLAASALKPRASSAHVTSNKAGALTAPVHYWHDLAKLF